MIQTVSNDRSRPLLSVVATARNDNHGGALLERMQIFVNGVIEQCERHGIDAHLDRDGVLLLARGEHQVPALRAIQEEMAEDLAFIFLVHNETGTAAANTVRDVHNWTTPDGTPGSDKEGVIHPFYQIWLDQ